MKKFILRQKGFTLIEVIVVLLIAFIITFAALTIFNRSFEGSIAQDQIAYMDGTIRSASVAMAQSVSNAGFGFLNAPDYAIRTYNNTGSTFGEFIPTHLNFDAPDTNPLFLLGSGSPTFTIPAKQHSDALLTLSSDPNCEWLEIDETNSSWNASVTSNQIINACLPQLRCPIAQDALGIPKPPGTPLPELLTQINGFPRVLLLVKEGTTTQNENLALRITQVDIIPDPGFCGAPVLQIQATGTGIQINGAATNFTTSPNNPPISTENIVARFIFSHFYYLGNDNNLYDIPLTYFEEGSTDNQTNRILAHDVEDLQFQYYVYIDPIFGNPRDGGLAELNPPPETLGLLDDNANDNDDVPQTEDIRFVELALLVRAEKEDLLNFKDQGMRPSIFDHTISSSNDSYRRRIIRQQMLAKNLLHFNLQTIPSGNY